MIEIDGPAMAFFETAGERREYTSFALKCPDFDLLAKTTQASVEHIRGVLKDRPDGLLVWRKRPQIEWDDEGGMFYSTFRIWSNYEFPELGMPIRLEGAVTKELLR